MIWLCCVVVLCEDDVFGDEEGKQTQSRQFSWDTPHIWKPQKAEIKTNKTQAVKSLLVQEYKRQEKKWEANSQSLRRTANYLRKRRLVLMLQWCLCPNLNGTAKSSFCQCFVFSTKIAVHGGSWGDTAQTLAQWWHPVASSVELLFVVPVKHVVPQLGDFSQL